MKLIYALSATLLSLSSASAWAFPAVGDLVVFALKIEQSGSGQTGTLSHELTQFNAANHQYLQISTVILGNGAPDVNQQWLKNGDLQSQQKIAILLGSCSLSGGTRQTIQVPAGNFETCVITASNGADSGQYWVGQVPFGIVRFVTTKGGRKSTGDLQTFRAP